jgi:hypothetical protein
VAVLSTRGRSRRGKDIHSRKEIRHQERGPTGHASSCRAEGQTRCILRLKEIIFHRHNSNLQRSVWRFDFQRLKN